jgi:hypothetical protein
LAAKSIGEKIKTLNLETKPEEFFKNKCTLEKAQNWTDLLSIQKKYFQNKKGSQWIFKGHKCDEWHLKPTFERAVENIGGTMKDGIDGHNVLSLEDALIRRFKRQYHHFENDRIIPRTMECLALMQHHGAPTRLLDWTYSFYVSIFFAVEKAKDNFPCSIWAFDSSDKWLVKRVESLIPDLRKTIHKDNKIEKDETFKKIFQSDRKKRFVYLVNPYRLNERLVIQQGTFLCPGNLFSSFKDNLLDVIPDGDTMKLIIIKLDSKISERRKILGELHRMNISRATLFPGLDGFAQSIGTMLAFPEVLGLDSEF